MTTSFNRSQKNRSQKEAVDYLRELPNGMGIITSPAATGKTTFVERVVQPFLANQDQATKHMRILMCPRQRGS